MHRLITVVITLLLSFVFSTKLAFAQAAPVSLLEQKRDGATVQPISSGTLTSLGDPLFKLVLKDRANVTNLAEIETLIKGQQGQEQTFVVDETIVDTRPTVGNRPATRRAVVTFTGRNQGERLDRNVMLSVFFTSENFPDVQSIEALGWDGQRGRYNYYKLDQQGTPGRLSWKFRDSSVQADLLQPAQRSGTCLQCHVNGAPVMKELALPWNNWHSISFAASYLKSNWKVGTNSPRIAQNLGGAERLETGFIAPAINEFNNKRIDESIARNNGSPVTNPNGSQQITTGKRLLRPLFVTTEVNFISSNQQVGSLHPFGSSATPGPFADVKIPNSFFLNANFINGSPPQSVQGLKIADSLRFQDIAVVKADEYRQLVNRSGVKLDGKAGDANFAWFVPEPSHVDNSMIDQLVKRGVITPEFVAAIMAVDLEKPVFSSQRQKLLQFIPDQFSFQPLQGTTDPFSVKRHPDDLTQKVIAALAQANPTSNSAEAQFLAILRNNNPLQVLKERTQQYSNSIDQKLNKSGATARQAELKRLYDLTIARRREVLSDPVLTALNETGNELLPLPDTTGIASVATAQ
ncbi:hypothetical protein DP113_17450 [Brasilonema octagenarum UFV-E1]|uniref:Cytochrome c domain-containing protein n=1 Tax=Brasilonema sennae CENA114 TaxID=415709 RepID=A0A856MGS2_9CYAN|nr:hypothetical protein [Brasilonema sennae]QDL09454.1 hypothetical protein DP114_17515 [Brasilonema sennae CENA114]QDL15810.1 hypothetical protein DP113_17450 [Brasilonema octagenarum UFV-E1]